MAWLGAVGAAVVGYFGVSVAASSLAAMVVGGIVVGAAAGALYSAVSGGNILKGALYGALGGAVVGAGGWALGFGGTGAASATAVPEVGAAGSTTLGAETASTGAILGGTNTVAAKTTAGALFTAENVQAMGAVASLGSAFMKGGDTLDTDAQLAEAEKDRELRRKESADRVAASEKSSDTSLQQTMAQIASNEKISQAERDLKAEQFTADFDFRTRQYEEEAALVETGRQRFETGIKEGADYVKSNTPTVSLVEVSEQRKSLPGPSWWEEQQTQPEAA